MFETLCQKAMFENHWRSSGWYCCGGNDYDKWTRGGGKKIILFFTLFYFMFLKKVDSFNTFCILVLLEDNQRWLILWRPTLTNLAFRSSSGVELARFGRRQCEDALFPHLCWPRLHLSICHGPSYSVLMVVMTMWIWIHDIEILDLNLYHDRQEACEGAVSLQVHAGATCN